MVALIGMLVGLAVVSAFLGLYRYALQAQELEQRFDGVPAVAALAPGAKTERPKLRERLDAFLAKASFASKARARLSRADVKLTVTEYVLLRTGVTGVAFLAGWAISRRMIGGVLLALLASLLPNFYVNRLQAKRLQAFQDQLPDVLSLLVNSLRAGHGLMQAINLVGQEMPEPSCTEFCRVRREVNLGVSMSEALSHMVDRLESDDLELMVTAVNVQHEVGGNLAEILDTISGTIRERVRILGEVRTMTAQQRLVGTVLAGLPFLLGTVLMLMNPDYMMGLFLPGLPRMLAAGATGMVVMGYLLIQKMLKLDV